MSDARRYREFAREELSAEQCEVFDAIAATRNGQVPVPFSVLLESPELASLTQALGAFCRYRTGLAPKLSELTVLIVAAHWGADYEFCVHAPIARKEGVPEAVIAALRTRATPQFEDGDAKLLYDFATTVFAKTDIPDALFAEAIARFGRRRVVELVGVLGYYSSLAILLRVFRVAPRP
jgi:4-carboxymuconolactone decarboxylase